MIRIDHFPSSVLVGWESWKDCANMTRVELLWHCFPGVVQISTEEGLFRTGFESVPALHFALSQLEAAEQLASGSEQFEYSFTESSDWILYRLEAGVQLITCSFSNVVLRTSLAGFFNESRAFTARTIVRLGEKYPRLHGNQAVGEILSQFR